MAPEVNVSQQTIIVLKLTVKISPPQFSLKNKPKLFSPCVCLLLFCLPSAEHHYGKLLHRVGLHFVHICCPVRSGEVVRRSLRHSNNNILEYVMHHCFNLCRVSMFEILEKHICGVSPRV